MKSITFVYDLGKLIEGFPNPYWENNGRKLPQLVTVVATGHDTNPYDDYGVAVELRFLDEAGVEIAPELFAGAVNWDVGVGLSFRAYMKHEAAPQLWPEQRDELSRIAIDC